MNYSTWVTKNLFFLFLSCFGISKRKVQYKDILISIKRTYAVVTVIKVLLMCVVNNQGYVVNNQRYETNMNIAYFFMSKLLHLA